MKFEFEPEIKTKQVKRQNNNNLSVIKGEVDKEEQESGSAVHDEIDDDWDDFGEVLPEDNLVVTEEQAKTEKPEVKKLRVEDVQPAKELKDVIPFSNSHVIKDIARNPFVARVILYLEEHGYSNYAEMTEALGISEGSLWFTFDKLKKIGFPIVKINKAEQFNKHMTYYDLKRSEQLTKDLKELRVWYEYYALKAFMKALPEFKWIELEELKHNYNFLNLMRRYGFDFNGAIQLLAKFGVVYVKGVGEHFTRIKRAFDNSGVRVSDIEGKDLIA